MLVGPRKAQAKRSRLVRQRVADSKSCQAVLASSDCQKSKATPDIRRIAFAIALETGARSSELSDLRWSAIDSEARELWVGSERHERAVPITDVLCDELEKQKASLNAGQQDFVLPNSHAKHPSRLIASAQLRAGLSASSQGFEERNADGPAFGLYDLRRTTLWLWARNELDVLKMEYLAGRRIPWLTTGKRFSLAAPLLKPEEKSRIRNSLLRYLYGRGEEPRSE